MTLTGKQQRFASCKLRVNTKQVPGWYGFYSCNNHTAYFSFPRTLAYTCLSSRAHKPQLLTHTLQLLKPMSLVCALQQEATAMKSPCPTTKSSPCSPKVEKAHVQQEEPTSSKNNNKITITKWLIKKKMPPSKTWRCLPWRDMIQEELLVASQCPK